jgi:hypothetical protein
MFTSRDFKTLLLLAASLLVLQADALAQSGRREPARSPVPPLSPAPAPTPTDYTHYDKVKVVVSRGIEEFVKALNEQGRLGYRLEKTVGYGDPKESQTFAAVLHLDPGHRYDYFSGSMPEDARYGEPLNYDARRGYTLAHAYAITQCRQVDVYDPHDPPGSTARQETQMVKWNVLLFMRRDAAETQTKEYRVFKGLFALDGGQKNELQAALDAAPQGFRPVRLLFSSAGPFNFNVTVVAERDLNESAPPKVEYQLVKEVFGFEDEVNRLAAAGSRYVVGGRHELVKIALLERQAGGSAAYTFKDGHQHRKEFPRMLAAGNSYVGLMADVRSCNSSEVVGQKLVFGRDAGGDPAREFKILEIADHKAAKRPGVLSGATASELQRLLADGFRVRDFFYSHGLYAILEKQAASPAPRTQTGER